MRASLLRRLVRRAARGARGRLLFFTACLAVGVAAVVGVAALVGALEDGLRVRSRELLAADLVVSSRQPLPQELDALLAEAPGVRRSDVIELTSTAAAPDGQGGVRTSHLVQLKVVDGPYPHYGTLQLDPPGELAATLGAEACVVDPELLRLLGLGTGDELLLGGKPFRVAAAVLSEPDRLGFSLMAGPRVFLSGAGWQRADMPEGSIRVRYEALLAVPGGRAELTALERRLESGLPRDQRLRLESHEEAQPNVREGLEQVRRYLGLVALLSLVLGGVGVARIVRTWLAERTEAIATLRCLGFRPREVLFLYLGHVVLLALAGSLAGALVGGAMPLAAPALAPGLLVPGLVQPWQPEAIGRGLLLGLGVAVVFALSPLAAVLRVSPARVLRADAAPLPARRWLAVLTWLVLAGGVYGAAWTQSESVEWASGFSAGLLGVALLLAGASRGVMVLASRLRGRTRHPYLVHGLAALARPGAGTTGAITVLGLGVMVVAAMALVQWRLEDELLSALPEDAPSAFLVDVQPGQWPALEALLLEEGARDVASVPWATARLAAVGGRPVEELVGEVARRHGRDGRREDDGRRDGPEGDLEEDDDGDGRHGWRRARWILTREQRLAWVEQLPESNLLVQGSWFDPADGRAEVSLEEDYAEDMGVGLGDQLVFDIQGVPVEATVTSLRQVEWRSFAINFFVLVEPGVLDQAPHLRVATARLDAGTRARVQDRLALLAPNVTLVDVQDILEKVADLLGALALAVRVLGGFTVVTGLAVLAGAVSSASLRRRREAALLKTLGVTRRGVAGLLATEHALTGLVAGLVGGAGALLIAEIFVQTVLELGPEPPLLALPLVALASAALATAAGLGASIRALAVPPLESLRA